MSNSIGPAGRGLIGESSGGGITKGKELLRTRGAGVLGKQSQKKEINKNEIYTY